jgi:hypothetical protein
MKYMSDGLVAPRLARRTPWFSVYDPACFPWCQDASLSLYIGKGLILVASPTLQVGLTKSGRMLKAQPMYKAIATVVMVIQNAIVGQFSWLKDPADDKMPTSL